MKITCGHSDLEKPHLLCVSQHVQALPTEKITKKPIPEEHLILKTTFEALIQRCLLSASDPVGLCGVLRVPLCLGECALLR